MRPGRVVFPGERGAFAEEAALALWPQASLVPARTVGQVAEVVASGEADAGVLPVENTVAGGVVAAYDALADAPDLYAIAEVILEVNQCLVAVPGATLQGIASVESHPVALAQCAAFIRLMPNRGVREVPTADTASAARAVAESRDPGRAAIASRHAAVRYGLTILAQGIADRPDNQTRFLGVACAPVSVPTGVPARTSLVFTTPNEPGSLLRALEPIARGGLNLSKLESRPTGEPWTYRFFADVDHPAGDPRIGEAIEAVRAATSSCRVMGTYSRA